MRRRLFEPDHEAFRKTVREFLDREVVPHAAEWDDAGIVPRGLFPRAGEVGMLGMAVPESYGGGGVDDFRFNTVLSEEVFRAQVAGAGTGIILHNDVCLPYFLRYTNDEQRRRWLPGLVSGELITAIAMTEPSTGSDLASISTTAIRDGHDYVLNGAKTFITNGINADLVIVAAKTDPAKQHDGLSLLVVERDMPGFTRGRKLDKLGMPAQDTAELFFDDVRVPATNLLGEEGQGFLQLVANLPQERLSIAVGAVASAAVVLDWTLEYVKSRTAFGRPIGSFQNSRFKIAEMATEIDLAQQYVDRCVEELVAGELSVEDAAKAKWWTTEMQGRVIDASLQLFGGYGYMLEYPIARAYRDARVTRIFGGTTEVMKEIIGRTLGL